MMMNAADENKKFPKILRPSSTSNINKFKNISLLLFKFCRPYSNCTCLHLFTYIYMEKKIMHDVAEIFAKEANLSCQNVIILKKMESGKDWGDKYMFQGKEWDAEKMLHLYIYDYMKKRGLDAVAETFAKEANLEIFEVVDSAEGLLTEWWELFWPQFCSRMENKSGGNPGSSAQPSIQNVLSMLASLKGPGAGKSKQSPIGNPQRNVIPTPVINHQLAANQANDLIIDGGGSYVNNVTGQPPASMLQTPSGISQRRAGKLPMNTDTASILGQSATQAFGKGSPRFSPVQLLTSQITPVPSSHNFGQLQMPVTIQPPLQVARATKNDVSQERSVQVESTYPAGQDSAYPLAAPNPGLSDD